MLIISGIDVQEVWFALVVLQLFRWIEDTKLIKSICKGVCSFKDEVNNVEKEIDEINDSEQKK